jgi:fructose-1,6-bisphosphatase/inositol monophosphatase family enzyme
MRLEEKRELMRGLGEVAKAVGEEILTLKGEKIRDIEVFLGHEVSTIDEEAREIMERCLNIRFSKLESMLEGIRYYELRPREVILLKKKRGEVKEPQKYTLIIDEIEGTTNTKRALASGQNYRPISAISIALCLGENLGSIQVGVIYALDQKELYMAMRVDDGFLAYRDDQLLYPEDFEKIKGDDHPRILVIGYSNKERIKKGELEDVLYNQGKFRVYEGCRASAVDIINILRNQYDAYVDLRALWGEKSGAMLQVYDVAGVIPIALGCGLRVSDVYDHSLDEYKRDDFIPLVISRSDPDLKIQERIIELTKPLVEKWKEEGENAGSI